MMITGRPLCCSMSWFVWLWIQLQPWPVLSISWWHDLAIMVVVQLHQLKLRGGF
jgi:hypothetical protein